MFKYVFDDACRCADFTIDEGKKKGFLLFVKTNVQSLPIKTEYDSLTIELYHNGLLEPIPHWVKMRTWELTKVRMESIGQDEATFFATLTYGDVIVTDVK